MKEFLHKEIGLYQTMNLFRWKIVSIDVALVHAVPPDNHGSMRLQVSMDTREWRDLFTNNVFG